MAQELRIRLQCRRFGFNPWIGKIPWSRKWQPTPIFLPGESHGERSLADYSPWDHKRVGPNLVPTPPAPAPPSVQFTSVAQSCPTICKPVDCSTPGLPVHHWLLEFIQTHVHIVGDAIQPSHPLSSPSPPAFNLSQHQSLFQ